MLRVGGLHEELQQRTLHNLWEVCGERAILPESCMISCQFSHSTAEPCIPSRYAEVRKAQTSPREGSGGAMDVCIKVIELEKVHKVGESSYRSPGRPIKQYPSGIPWGRCAMGEAEASEHPPVFWRVSRSPPNCDGVDAKWISHGVCAGAQTH